jgi:hypothetical protein
MAPKKRTIYAVTDRDLESIHDYELATLVNQARYDLTQFIDEEATAANILQEEEEIAELEREIAKLEAPPSPATQAFRALPEGIRVVGEYVKDTQAELQRLKSQVTLSISISPS